MYELLKVSGIHKLNFFQTYSLKKFLRGQTELQQSISSYPENLVRFFVFVFFLLRLSLHCGTFPVELRKVAKLGGTKDIISKIRTSLFIALVGPWSFLKFYLLKFTISFQRIINHPNLMTFKK